MSFLISFTEYYFKDETMTKEQKILAMENRLHKLKSNGKNLDSPGVAKKLERKIMKLKES